MPAEDDSRWITAWMLLVRTHTRFWGTVEEQMRRDHGLTMARYDVLAQLDTAGGRLGLSELASAIALSPSGLSKLLDRMDASGLIQREPDPTDQRATFAAITPRGQTLVRSARNGHHALLRRTFATPLNDRDLADLTRILKKLETTTRRRSDTSAT
jgi:DNA-binding MarR family transcriptional regulator